MSFRFAQTHSFAKILSRPLTSSPSFWSPWKRSSPTHNKETTMTRGNLFSELTYASELEVRIRKVRLAENEEGYFSKCLRSPEDTYNLFKAFFDKSPVELFLVLHLKTNTRLSAFEIVSKGILNQTLVHPREVFKSAILRNAASIIIAHNHPSGNSEPTN